MLQSAIRIRMAFMEHRNEHSLRLGHPITGLILAGGRGTRMHGSDKGLLPLRGVPLIGHVIARLRPQVQTLLVNANRNQAAYAEFGLPVVADTLAGHQGPLAGIAAGLAASRTEWVLTAPCDTPFLPHDLVRRLATAAAAQACPAAVVHAAGSLQPLSCLLHRSLLPDLLGYLERGGRKARDWLARHDASHVHFEDGAAFMNINAPDTLARLEAQAC